MLRQYLTLAPYGMYYDDGTGTWGDEAVRDIGLVATSVAAQKILQSLASFLILFQFESGRGGGHSDHLAELHCIGRLEVVLAGIFL